MSLWIEHHRRRPTEGLRRLIKLSTVVYVSIYTDGPRRHLQYLSRRNNIYFGNWCRALFLAISASATRPHSMALNPSRLSLIAVRYDWLTSLKRGCWSRPNRPLLTRGRKSGLKYGARIRDVREWFLCTHSLPFPWLRSHSYSRPWEILDYRPIPIPIFAEK